MFTVYVLKDKTGKCYKGITSNLSRRLREHKSGQTKSTKHLQEPRVAYTENYPSRTEARNREKYLKTAAGRRFLKRVLGP